MACESKLRIMITKKPKCKKMVSNSVNPIDVTPFPGAKEAPLKPGGIDKSRGQIDFQTPLPFQKPRLCALKGV
jgi:hypothetical protein